MPLLPSPGVKSAINRSRNKGFIASSLSNIGSLKPKTGQYFDNICLFFKKVIIENGAGVLPFMDFVVITNKLWQ